MDDYTKANLDWWNEAAVVHAQGDAYELASFKAGKTKLHFLELEEVGGVAGKTLLHLQCHFGLDTLSWARLGAKLTGIDFSDQAIALAQSLSQELQLDATFICTELYNLPAVLDKLHASVSLPLVYSPSVLPNLSTCSRFVNQRTASNSRPRINQAAIM